MITRREALRRVRECLAEDTRAMQAAFPGTWGDDELVVLEDRVRVYLFGWVFPYSSRRYEETGDSGSALYGCGPLIVDRWTGRLYRARGPGMFAPPDWREYYRREYRRLIQEERRASGRATRR